MLRRDFYIEYIVGESLGGSLGMTPCYVENGRIYLCDGSYGLLDFVDSSHSYEETPAIVERIESEAMQRILAGETEGFISFRPDVPTVMFRVEV